MAEAKAGSRPYEDELDGQGTEEAGGVAMRGGTAGSAVTQEHLSDAASSYGLPSGSGFMSWRDDSRKGTAVY